jgi:hypothetical protein
LIVVDRSFQTDGGQRPAVLKLGTASGAEVPPE